MKAPAEAPLGSGPGWRKWAWSCRKADGSQAQSGPVGSDSAFGSPPRRGGSRGLTARLDAHWLLGWPALGARRAHANRGEAGWCNGREPDSLGLNPGPALGSVIQPLCASVSPLCKMRRKRGKTTHVTGCCGNQIHSKSLERAFACRNCSVNVKLLVLLVPSLPPPLEASSLEILIYRL